MLKQLVIIFLSVFLFFNQANAQTYQRISREQAIENHKKMKKNNKEISTNRFYLGLDYNKHSTKLNKFKYCANLYGVCDNSDTAYDTFLNENIIKKVKDSNYSFVVGYKFHPYFSLELFYQTSINGKYRETLNRTEFSSHIFEETINYKSYGADLIGYLPILKKLDLLYSLGLGYYNFDFDYKGNFNASIEFPNWSWSSSESVDYKKSENSLGLRAGLGVGFNITDDLSLRLMARYIKMQKADIMDNILEYSLGFRYMF